ncbi:MAG: hypothetical protein JNL61_03090 [Rhizobiaceae bacterium]|nr:hypothetical protein [Rhizobiaceae bacterium]
MRDRIEENEFAYELGGALAAISPEDPPRFMARTPHGYYDTALIRGELEKAGFSAVATGTRAQSSRAPSPRIAAAAYRQGTPLRNEIETRDAGKMDTAIEHAASAIAARHGKGEVVGKIQAHVISAVA